MTQVDPGSANHAAEASSRHLARGQEASELSDVSFASTLTDAQDADLSATLQSEASTAHLLGNSTKPSFLAWSEPDQSVDVQSSTIKHVGTSSASNKGKHTSNGHHLDLDHPKLSTIDETAAANASSYTSDDLYNSSANGYLQYDADAQRQLPRRADSNDFDEAPYSPSTYPPTSEEDSEAKRVQQNLERWAAEERQRRKAQRTSKIISNRNSAVSGGSGIAHRLSMLRSAGFNGHTQNNLGAGPSSERLADGASASPSLPYSATLGDRRRDPAVRRESGSSSIGVGAARGLHRSVSRSSFESSQSHGSLVSDDHRPNRDLPQIGSRVSSATHGRQASGGSVSSSHDPSHRANGGVRDPFRDPSEGGNVDTSNRVPLKRSSLKPTPTASRPIVTVGRASSIQRRALEATYTSSKGKGKGRSMPTIVATDTEAEAEAEADADADAEELGRNPFSSSQDRQRRTRSTSTTIHQGGLDEEVAMEFAGRSKGLDMNGDLGETSLDTSTTPRPPPARTSTSSSRFRELGITEGDDWIDSMEQSTGKDRGGARRMRIARHADASDEQDEGRKPWWSELLCGCSRDYDDDEQAGRTNPME